MLPDLRSMIAALVTGVGVLLIGVGVAGTLRTAQDRIVSPLQEARERLRADPFAAAPPVVTVPAVEDPNALTATRNDPLIAVASVSPTVPERPQAEAAPVVAHHALGDAAVAAAPPSAPETPAPQVEAIMPSDLQSQAASVADSPSDRFVIESLVCPPATTAPEPSMTAASEPATPSAPPRLAAGIPLPRERPAVGGPAPDEPVVTGSLQPSRTASMPPRAVQKRGAKRMAARVTPRRRPAPRSRPAPRQRGFFETLFGL